MGDNEILLSERIKLEFDKNHEQAGLSNKQIKGISDLDKMLEKDIDLKLAEIMINLEKHKNESDTKREQLKSELEKTIRDKGSMIYERINIVESDLRKTIWGSVLTIAGILISGFIAIYIGVKKWIKTIIFFI